MSLLANKQITKGWHFDSTSGKWVYGVYNSSGAVKKVFDEDGALYQEDTKLTLTAAQLNGTSTPLTSPVLTTPQVNDTTADHQYVFAVNELAADRTVTLPLLTGNDEFVFKDHAVTMTNKTLTAPVLTTPQVNDTTADHQYVFAVNELAADRTVTLPLLTGNDEFVFKDHAVTMTNKTLTAPVLTTPQINDTTADHQYVFAVNELTADRTVTLPLLTGNDEFTFNAHAQTLTNKTLTSPVLTTPQINDTTADHQYVFAVNELTADRTVTLPLLTGNDEFTFNAHAQTLTNKTLTSPVLTTPQINDTTADHQYVFAVNELTADRTVTLPLLTGNDEFTFNAHAQTLTNKTLTAPVMTNPSSTFTIGTHDYGTGTDDWTLSAAELLKTVHKPTNAGGAVNAIIADTAGIPYIFINGTGHTLTVKGTGTGIAIANGKTAIVMSDGINVIALAAESA